MLKFNQPLFMSSFCITLTSIKRSRIRKVLGICVVSTTIMTCQGRKFFIIKNKR